jgi:hypothetical protein
LRKENDIMKTNLKKIIGLAALGMTLLTNTVTTWAGYKFTPEVFVEVNPYPSPSLGHGSMVGARYSTDSTQYIGCTAYALSSYSWTTCFAMDRAGKYAVCGSGDPRWAEVVQGMTDSSFIYFEATYNYGDCKLIQIVNDSHLLK